MSTTDREIEYCCIPPTKVVEHNSFLNVSVCVPPPVKFVLAIIFQLICSYNDRYFVLATPTHLGSLEFYVFNTIYNILFTASSEERSIIDIAFRTDMFCVTKHVKFLPGVRGYALHLFHS